MNLKDRIALTKVHIEKLQEKINPLIERYDYLISCTQPKFYELWENPDAYIKCTVQRKKYKHILGGDGRSAPWDEERVGNVMTITIRPKIYLPDGQKKIIKEHLIEKITDKNIDHVVYEGG